MNAGEERLFVVTGASGELGQCLLREVTRRGFRVEGVGRSSLPEEGRGESHFTQMDCTDPREVDGFWKGMREAYPEKVLVVLINNAGKYHQATFDATDISTVEQIMADNFLSSVGMFKGFLSHFASGTVVNIVSFAALNPRPNLAVYGSAKAALSHFYSAIRGELPAGRFRILNVYPLRINTWSEDPQPGTIQKEEAARWIVDLALVEGSFEISNCEIVPFGPG